MNNNMTRMESFRDLKKYHRILNDYFNFYDRIVNEYKSNKQGYTLDVIPQARINYCYKLRHWYKTTMELHLSHIMDTCIIPFPPMGGAGVSNDKYYKDIKYNHCNILHCWNEKCRLKLRKYSIHKRDNRDLKFKYQEKIIAKLNKLQAERVEHYNTMVYSHMKVTYEDDTCSNTRNDTRNHHDTDDIITRYHHGGYVNTRNHHDTDDIITRYHHGAYVNTRNHHDTDDIIRLITRYHHDAGINTNDDDDIHVDNDDLHVDNDGIDDIDDIDDIHVDNDSIDDIDDIDGNDEEEIIIPVRVSNICLI